jgi:glucose/arabinose dehydrogenase
VRRAIAVLAVVAAALGGVVTYRELTDGPPSWADCTSDAVAAPTTVPTDELTGVATQRVADVDLPTALVSTPDAQRLLVTTKAGEVLTIDPSTGTSERVLDLRARIDGRGERGLLGIAVAPAGDRVYLHLSEAPSGDAVIGEWHIARDGRIDATSEREVLREPDPHPYHNGGTLVFGPDGFLYIGIGDGGNPGDPGDPEDDAQDRTDLFGSILRIDPAASGVEPYTIPPDNPFVGDERARAEVFVTGLRNPWRFSFDRANDDLWIADVGHFCWEEVDRIAFADAAGANFGWRRLEGFHEFVGDVPDRHVLPVWEYRHTVGAEVIQGGVDPDAAPACGVIGGTVYRGAQIPDLQGAYVFTDICSDRIYALREVGGAVSIAEALVDPGGEVSMGEDAAGELYVLTSDAVWALVRG